MDSLEVGAVDEQRALSSVVGSGAGSLCRTEHIFGDGQCAKSFEFLVESMAGFVVKLVPQVATGFLSTLLLCPLIPCPLMCTKSSVGPGAIRTPRVPAVSVSSGQASVNTWRATDCASDGEHPCNNHDDHHDTSVDGFCSWNGSSGTGVLLSVGVSWSTTAMPAAYAELAYTLYGGHALSSRPDFARHV